MPVRDHDSIGCSSEQKGDPYFLPFLVSLIPFFFPINKRNWSKYIKGPVKKNPLISSFFLFAPCREIKATSWDLFRGRADGDLFLFLSGRTKDASMSQELLLPSTSVPSTPENANSYKLCPGSSPRKHVLWGDNSLRGWFSILHITSTSEKKLWAASKTWKNSG